MKKNMTIFRHESSPKKYLIITSNSKWDSNVKKLVFDLKSRGPCSIQIITLGYHVFKELQSKDKTCKDFNSYFIEEDHSFDYKESIEISKLWFINSKGDDATFYNGVSIGVILQRSVINLLNDLLSNIRTVQRIFSEEKPDGIWLAFGNGKKCSNESDYAIKILSGVFSLLAKNKDVPCHKLDPFIEERFDNPDSFQLKLLLQKSKSLIYSLLIRKLLFSIKYLIKQREIKCYPNILIPSPSALNYLGKTVIENILSDSKRTIFVWNGETKEQKLNIIDIPPPLLLKNKQNHNEINSRVERQFYTFFQKTKIEDLKTAQNVLQQAYTYLIKPIVKDIISDIDKIEYTLQRINIKLVLSHTDTTIRERTVISVANRQKIPSLVLQHGAAGHYWGFLPLIATKFAAWGESTKKWFIKNNINEDRIDVTGTANFDSYLQAIYNNKISGTTSWHGMKNFLLYVTVKGNKFQTGTTQTERDNEILFGAILSVVETIPERILVIKLKSGDAQEEYYKSEIKRRELKNVFLVSATDNRKLLNACGVLITTCSTMAFEALIFEKPIIQLNFLNKSKLFKILYQQSISCLEDGISLARNGAAIGIDSPDDFKKAILDIYSNKNLRKLIIEKGKDFLKYTCSEQDGKASDRVSQQIENLIQRNESLNTFGM